MVSDNAAVKAYSLSELAAKIRNRSMIDSEIAKIIRRPAERGHIGEYIASVIFEIQLNGSARQKSSDGHFLCDPLKGRSVNVKWYGLQEYILDLDSEIGPDYYLVFTGPKSLSTTSVGGERPLVINKVFLFPGPELINDLQERGRVPGKASYIPVKTWDAAEIYPNSSPTLTLTGAQRKFLELFSPNLNFPSDGSIPPPPLGE
jgi:hypothetical protein